MNNIKIKSNSLKKKTAPYSENIKIEKVNFPFPEKKSETETEKMIYKDNLSNFKNSLVQHVNKLIKSPSLNLVSKIKEKTKATDFKSLSLNFIEKQLQNSINSSNDLKKETNSKRNSYNIDINQSDIIPNRISQDKLNYKSNCDINNKKLILNPDKRINIKFNFNSEVINNNIKISNKSINDANSINSMNHESTITQLKETMQFQMDLIEIKDKEIESLKSELKNIKSFVGKQTKTQQKPIYLDYLTSLTNSCSIKPGGNEYLMKRSSPALKFKLELQNKIPEKLSQEIYSDRIAQNHSTLSKAMLLKENYKSASNNSSVINLVGDQTNSSIISNKYNFNGSKMYFASHNCFRKSNTKGLFISNPKSISNINSSDINQISMNNFLKGCALASNRMTLKSMEKSEEKIKKGYSHYNLNDSKSMSPVKKAFEDKAQSTVEKINKSDTSNNTVGVNNAHTANTDKVNFKQNSSRTNSNLNRVEKASGDSESLMHELTQIRNRASNALKIYSEFAVKRTNEKRGE